MQEKGNYKDAPLAETFQPQPKSYKGDEHSEGNIVESQNGLDTPESGQRCCLKKEEKMQKSQKTRKGRKDALKVPQN